MMIEFPQDEDEVLEGTVQDEEPENDPEEVPVE
jgi:hypothetical protein